MGIGCERGEGEARLELNRGDDGEAGCVRMCELGPPRRQETNTRMECSIGAKKTRGGVYLEFRGEFLICFQACEV